MVGPSADIYLRNMIAARAYPSPQGIFLDRRLTAAEARHVQVRLDLGRDADVLVVARDHPACAAGVSRAAAGDRRREDPDLWPGRAAARSRCAAPAPASDGFVEPRFGADFRLPKGAKAAYDGGLAEAAAGNLAIAAVTSWSRARAFQATTCAVRIGGKAPTDASVRALSHPDAYPISFVTLKQLRAVAPIVAAFRQYLIGPRATASFRQRGMLLAKAPWPKVAGPQAGP